MTPRDIAADERGVAALEFGLIAPPLALLVIGGIEIGLSLFLNAAIEQGVIEASRFAVTGATAPGITREERVVQIIREHSFGLADIRQTDITTLIYPSFTDIGQPEPFTDANGNGSFDAGEQFTDINGDGQWNADMGAAGLGGPGDIVVYRVNYSWGFLTRMLESVVADVTMTGAIAVRNEPF
jgi:Flp pilus assembly pilin Flp